MVINVVIDIVNCNNYIFVVFKVLCMVVSNLNLIMVKEILGVIVSVFLFFGGIEVVLYIYGMSVFFYKILL